MTTLESLQPLLITITPGGQIDFIWTRNLLTLASKSLVAQRVGERFVEESGAEYRVDAARIVGRAPGSLFERIVTFTDPAVDLDLSIVPTGRVVPVDELKRLLPRAKTYSTTSRPVGGARSHSGGRSRWPETFLRSSPS